MHHSLTRRAVARLTAIAMALAIGLVGIGGNTSAHAASTTWESLTLAEKQSSYGFFMYEAENGTSDAMKSSAEQAASYLKTAKFASQYTRIGQKGDATSLDNFLLGAKLLVNFNNYRASLANEPCRHDLATTNAGYVKNCTATSLTPLKASYQGFSEAQANTNYSANVLGHAGNAGQKTSFWTGWSENEGWGSSVSSNFDYTTSTPHGSMSEWYGEINTYNTDTSNYSSIGHYTNMTNKYVNDGTVTYLQYTSSGYAYNDYSDAAQNKTYRCTDGVDFYTGDQGYTLDPAAFVSQIENYISLVKTIASVTTPGAVTTPSGTTPTLPSTVAVTYSDGTTGTANVTWDTTDTTWKNRAGGSYTVSGTVHDPVANTDIPTSVDVTVTPATVSAVAANGATTATVAPGTSDPASGLTTKATITYSNGDTADGAIDWSVSGTADGAHLKETQLNATGTVKDSDGKAVGTVPGTITVTPITVSSIDPVAVSTTTGNAPTLPSTVTVNWSYGDPSAGSVTWNSIDSTDYSKAGTFTVDGAVTDSDGTSLGTATATVTVTDGKPATVVFDGTTSDATAVTVNAGTDPSGLLAQKTATVTYTDDGTATGTKVKTTSGLAVTWKTPEGSNWYHGSIDGATSQTVTGTVEGLPVTATVTINQATPTSAVITGTTSANAAVTTPAGTKPTLPTTATVTYSNGDTKDAAITWGSVSETDYHGSTDNDTTFVVSGTAEGLPVTATVTVSKATPTSAVIAGTNSAETTVTTPAGTAANLPATATVSYSNGDTKDVTIAWDNADYTGSTDNDTMFDVNGTAEGFTFTAHVTVSKATPTQAVITGTDSAETTVTTPAGTKPNLPVTATVSYSNGDTKDVAIAWDNADYTGSTDNDTTFDVSGTAGAFSFTAHVTVSKATPTSVGFVTTDSEGTQTTSTEVQVLGQAGVEPTLPKNATVTYSNGATKPSTVSWNTPSGSDWYQGSTTEDTTVDVTGTVSELPGTTLTAHVKLTSADISTVYITGTDPASAETTVTTDAGSSPTLPTTATVTYTNGVEQETPIVWDSFDDTAYHGSADAATSFDVTGTAAGRTLTAHVTVSKATPTSAVITGTNSTETTVTTPAGTAANLPATATVSYSNGDTKDVTIAWDNADYTGSTDADTMFDVNGTAEGFTFTAHVTVSKASPTSVNFTDDGDASTGVDKEFDETVTVGDAISLPTTIGAGTFAIVYSNGQSVNSGDWTIVWNATDAQLTQDASTAGTYAYKGLAYRAMTDDEAQAIVSALSRPSHAPLHRNGPVLRAPMQPASVTADALKNAVAAEIAEMSRSDAKTTSDDAATAVFSALGVTSPSAGAQSLLSDWFSTNVLPTTANVTVNAKPVTPGKDSGNGTSGTGNGTSANGSTSSTGSATTVGEAVTAGHSSSTESNLAKTGVAIGGSAMAVLLMASLGIALVGVHRRNAAHVAEGAHHQAD